jgi:hypothetical protein
LLARKEIKLKVVSLYTIFITMATKKPCMRGHAGLMILVFCQRLCDINLARDLNFLLYHLGQEEL